MSLLEIPLPFAAGDESRQIDVTYLSKRDFPSWHFCMLNDARRNNVIECSIDALQLEGKTVLEIGTGTGLIALLFARAGATKVITCEMNKNLAGVARHIINATPYGDRITVIDKSSEQAIAEKLFDIVPDYLFTETLDCGVIGESFFRIARDIQQLAGPHTTVIPSEVRQFGVVVESQAMMELNSVHDVCGFDLSLLNAFSTRNYFPVREQIFDYNSLCEPVLLRSYDYLSNRPATDTRVAVERDGRGDGVLTWMEIQFGDHVCSNEPGTLSHWHKAFHPFENPLQLQSGQDLELRVNDDGSVSAKRSKRLSSFDRKPKLARV